MRPEEATDSLAAWTGRYLELAVVGVRSRTVAEKAALHLDRFASFFGEVYGQDRISAVVRRDVQSWQRSLVEQGLAPSTANNHLASLSAFATWVVVASQSRPGQKMPGVWLDLARQRKRPGEFAIRSWPGVPSPGIIPAPRNPRGPGFQGPSDVG